MIGSVLVVCVGNICRSPLGERLLKAQLPGLRIGSAGLAAPTGAAADPDAAQVAAEIGVSLDGHVARQLSEDLARAHDLILVMEQGHRAEIQRSFPQFSGRVMLFDHWSGGKGIPDPFRKPIAVHRLTRDRIVEEAKAWAAHIQRSRKNA